MKKYLNPFCLAWLAYIPLTLIVIKGGFYGFHLNIVLGIIIFMGITYWFRRKSSNSRQTKITTLLIASPIIVFSGIYLLRPSMFYTSPNFLIAEGIGILLALGYEKNIDRFYKVIILFLPLLIGVWVYFQGAKIWEHYVIYETFKSGETFKKAPSFTFKKDSIVLTNNDFKGKIVVLDIWNTSCPYCYKKFPILKEKFEKWSRNGNINFYAVNFPVPNDTLGEAETILKKRNIHIPNLIGPNALDSYKTFGKFSFPLTIVLNPSGDIVFWGDIERIDKTIEKLLNKK